MVPFRAPFPLSLFRCGLLSRLRPIGRCARARPRRCSTYIRGASKQAVSDYVSQVLFQEAGSRRVPTARADASRLRTLRSMPLYWFFLGSAARVGVAAWGLAGCRPRGVTAPTTGSPAAAPMLGRPAPARCPVLGRCPSPGPNAGSMASSATWSPRGTKVPGQNPLGTAIQGPERARRSLARAAALRRARAPRRREGRFVYRERKRLLLIVSDCASIHMSHVRYSQSRPSGSGPRPEKFRECSNRGCDHPQV